MRMRVFLATVLAVMSCLARDMAINNGKLTSALNANGYAITNIPPPTADWDVATKAYVDAAGGMTPTQVTNISTFVASSATVTNAGAVAAAQAMTNGKLDSHHDISGFDASIAWDDDAGALKVDGAPLSVEQLQVSYAESIMIDGVPINSCTKIEDSTIKLWSNELTVVPVSGGTFSGNVGFGSNGAYIDSLGNAYFCSFSMMSDWVNLSAMGVNLPSYLASTEWHGSNKSLANYGITNTIPSKPSIETYAINAVSNSDNLWNASNAKLTATIDGEMTNRNSSAWTGISGSVIERIRTIETNVGTANAALEAILGGN